MLIREISAQGSSDDGSSMERNKSLGYTIDGYLYIQYLAKY